MTAYPPLPALTAQEATTLADRLLGTPLLIVGVVVGALLLRWLLHRAIKRVVDATTRRHEARLESLTSAAPGRVLARASGMAHERYVQRTATMGAVLRSLVTIVVATIAILTIMAALGIPLAPLLASAGVGGIALAFGAQSLIKDFITGAFMIMEDQYGVGDVIDTGAVTGTVEDLTLRITQLRDANGMVWYVRNGEIVRVGNRSQGWSTATVDVPVAYTENLPRVTTVIRTAIGGLADDPDWVDRVLETPAVAGVESISGGAVTIQVTVRCAPNQNVAVQRVIRERVKAAFDVEGITMAAPPV